ncbi:hypothetical protein AMTRI_Chr02g212330 [Amborella trichopoda]
MKGLVTCLLVLLVAHQLGHQARAIDCTAVTESLVQCVTYLTGATDQPAAACCAGMKHLTQIAATVADKRAACDCIRKEEERFHNIKEEAAIKLPGACGVTISVPISPNTDCSNINSISIHLSSP